MIQLYYYLPGSAECDDDEDCGSAGSGGSGDGDNYIQSTDETPSMYRRILALYYSNIILSL